MSQCDFKKLIHAAQKGKYAINAFNCADVWDMSAIIAAAEDLNAPVMVAIHPENFQELPLEVYAAFGKVMAQRASVPVVLHLDHCKDVETCKRAVDCGFPSVMIDASACSLEENIAATKEVVDYAHAHGCLVEAEVGRIKGHGYEGGYAGDDYLARTEDCVRLAKETGVDLLAVGIGTAHGYYEGTPKLSFERLHEIHQALTIPLVLHGGTGLAADDVRRCIADGICKVNVGTCIASAYMNGMKNELERQGENAFVIEVIPPVRAAVKSEVDGWIRTCMGDGKA